MVIELTVIIRLDSSLSRHTWYCHVDVIGVDVIPGRAVPQLDPGGVVGRDVSVAVLEDILGGVADGHGQVGVAPVQLEEKIQF